MVACHRAAVRTVQGIHRHCDVTSPYIWMYSSSAQCQSTHQRDDCCHDDGKHGNSQLHCPVAFVIRAAVHLILISPDEQAIFSTVGRTATSNHILQPIHHCHSLLHKQLHNLSTYVSLSGYNLQTCTMVQQKPKLRSCQHHQHLRVPVLYLKWFYLLSVAVQLLHYY